MPLKGRSKFLGSIPAILVDDLESAITVDRISG